MNFKSYLKNSIFRTFLFSYIVLILFYTVFSFPAIYYNNKKISSQIYKQNKLLLKESATKIENGLGSLPSIASSVLYNSEFSALLSSFSDGQIDYSKSYSVIAFLISVQNSVYAGTKTAVYFKNQDTIISSEGIYTAKNFYDGVYSFKNDSYDEWFKYLNDSKENYYILRDSSKEKKDRYLFYSCSKPKKNNVIVFTYIPCGYFQNIINEFYNNIGHNIVISDKSFKHVIIGNNKSKDTVSIISDKTDANKCISVQMSNNWYCYMIFNKKLLNDPLIKTWIMNIFVILIASIFSVLLAIFFSKKNYMPIYALKEHLYDKESAVQAGNDYDLIRSRITEIINSADTAKRKITDYSQIKAFRNILFDNYNASDMKMLRHEFLGNEFCVSIIYSDSESVKHLKSEAYSGADIDTIFENITEEILSQSYKAKMFPIDDFYCCIINGDKLDRKVVESAFDSIQTAISFYFNINAMTSIGNVCSATKISESYKNAKNTMSVMKMFGNKKIMRYNEISDSSPIELNAAAVKKNLMSALKENNPDLAYKIVSDAIDSSIQKFSTGQMIEQYIFYILQILDDAIKDLPQNGNDILYQCNNPYTSLIPFSGIEELKQKIKDYLHKVSLLMQEYSPVKSTEFMIKDYINQNYCNYELSAAIIAEQFGMSQSALSVLFKKTFNIGMSEYIAKLRIDKAKQLLTETDKPLEVIAQDVGYINIRSFFRAFKRIENITPRQYQKENRK